MTIHLPIAASTNTPHRVGDNQPAPDRGGRGSTLPAWAQSEEARAILAAIRIERPSINVYDDGLSAWNGRRYAGRNATRLRALFVPTYDTMIAWVDAAAVKVEPGRPQPELYYQRHDAVAAWAREFGPDRVISIVLGEGL